MTRLFVCNSRWLSSPYVASVTNLKWKVISPWHDSNHLATQLSSFRTSTTSPRDLFLSNFQRQFFKGLFTSIKKHMMFSSFYFGPLVCPSMSFRFSYLINKIVFALMEQLPTPFVTAEIHKRCHVTCFLRNCIIRARADREALSLLGSPPPSFHPPT